MRPLGIPTVSDRIAQQVAMRLEPLIDAEDSMDIDPINQR